MKQPTPKPLPLPDTKRPRPHTHPPQCPFINNCVGRANLRAFILFLACLCVACAYALAVCGRVMAAHWPVVAAAARSAAAAWAGRDVREQVHSRSSSIHTTSGSSGSGGGGGVAGLFAAATSLMFRASLGLTVLVAAAPWWLVATAYLAATCLAVLLCVAALLYAQLRYLAAGMTYIDSLKLRGRRQLADPGGDDDSQQQQQRERERLLAGQGSGGLTGSGGGGGEGSAGLWRRLVEVMGSDNVVRWLLVPQWEPPAGTLVADGKKAE